MREDVGCNQGGRVLNVVFDLGGVLLTWDPPAIVASVFDDEHDRALVLDLVFAHEDWQDLDRGLMNPSAAIERAVSRTGLRLVKLQALFSAIPRSLVPIPASVELLSQVREAAHPVYALSNLHRASLECIEDAYDIFDLFEGRVVSCEVGACKPEPAIYRYLLERFELDPASTVFIDDMQANLDAASAAGIRTVLFTSVESCRRDLDSLGCT
jgi:putative hydrolase of the HAD superfamily